VVRNVGGATDIKTVKTVKIHIARDIERGASDRAAMTEKSAAATKIGKTRKAIVKVETSVKPAEMTIIGLIENIKLERPVLIETRAVEGGEKEVAAARTVEKDDGREEEDPKPSARPPRSKSQKLEPELSSLRSAL
jgi:hypothetical protein